MATYKNLTVDQGSTFSARVSIAGDNGQPYDLSGYTVFADVRKSPTSANTSASFTCSISEPPTTGEVVLLMTDEETAAIKAGRYMYDLIIEDQFGARFRAIEGVVTVTPSITR